MNKKIAFITTGYADNNFSSGGLKLNFMLLQKFVEAGYNVDVYAKKYYNISGADGIRIFSFSDYKSSEEYDFVLSGNAVYPADVTYIHDHTNIFRFKNLYGPLWQFLYKNFNTKSLKRRQNEDIERKEVLCNTRKIVVSSEILKADYVKNYGLDEKKFEIIPPPITLGAQKHDKQKRGDTFVFGLAAVGFERKGGYVTLAAIARLRKKVKNFKVKIIYPKKNLLVSFLILIKGLSKFVEVVGCQEDMTEFYNSIDCLLMPSLVEPFGMVATEAMSFGRPVIVSKISGASDVVADGQNGLVVDCGKIFAQNLSHAMKRIIEMSENKYQEMSVNALASVQKLDISTFTDKYMDLLASIKNKI